MSKLLKTEKYTSLLGVYETQVAIGELRKKFEEKFMNSLNLCRISAPLFVTKESGLNDDLNGIERPVQFDIKETKTSAQIVHSLAKWKRYALYKYEFSYGQGLVTNMNAIRRDEEMDNLHSIYVDQWDWEKVIKKEERTIEYLKETVKKIVDAICDAKEFVNDKYPSLKYSIKRDVSFITTQELEDKYPNLSPKMREDEYLKEHKTAFIMKIGGVLKSGERHDGRAPDYDDWNLNGDILFWNETLNRAFEVSSMGIRVDSASLDKQLKIANANDRRSFEFHSMLLNDELPLTMGGGIGQSRLSMLLLEKAHIGEVQVSIWDDETKAGCKNNGINLL